MDGTIGQILLFASNFAPRNWAFCDGQLLPISQNTALFSIIGTIYGGDGRTTFALPDLRSRAAVGSGRGPGLTTYTQGERSGAPTVALTTANLPSHNHAAPKVASANEVDTDDPTGGLIGSDQEVFAEGGNGVDLAGTTTGNTGGGRAHNNMQPFLAHNYIICLQGTFPSRS